MMDVNEATRLIQANLLPLPITQVALTEACGRVLKEDIVADRDFPPFNRVAMDGIAIQFTQWEKGKRSFTIRGLQAAGMPQQKLQESDGCLEVMTGAVLPENTDTVIPYEQVDIADGKAQVQATSIKRGQHVHTQASDEKKGAVLIKAGVCLSPAEIAVAATVGKETLRVSALPTIAIISTGDELVDVFHFPLPHQIRRSNSYALNTALQEVGVKGAMYHLPDQKEALLEKLEMLLQKYDALILSGGVSKGKLDFVPDVLAGLGVQQLFHRVLQKPGKPFWFGKAENGKIVFALPGNPVSTFMCFYRFVRPWLQLSLGVPAEKPVSAKLSTDFTFKAPLTYFLQVKVHFSEGCLIASPVEGKGSGDLGNLVQADGFLELPKEKELFKAGESYPVYLYRKI